MRRTARPLLWALAAVLAVTAPARAAALNWTLSPLEDPAAAAGAQHGLSVASLGDVTGDGVGDVAVGAPGADRVRVLSGATRAVVRTITDPEGQPGNQFGFALAAVGDVNGDGVGDLAVGARGPDQPPLPLPCPTPPCVASPAQGRAFVFSGASGALIRKLAPPDTEFLVFGFSVAALGDVSGDGVPDVAVGAPTFLNNRFGQVYAFSGATGAVLWSVKEASQALASFGWSVASVPDLDSDGRRDLIVGAPFHDVDAGAGTALAGRAYLLSGQSGGVIRQHDNPLGSSGKNFGLSSTATGDQTGDGITDYAVSDPGAARVHLFDGAGGTALGTFATSGSPGDNFGADLATSEDRDADGRRDLWVGEPGAGKVVLVNRSGAVLLTVADPAPQATSSLLGFGFALASTADLGGDAGSDLLIGEPSAPSGAHPDAGAAHLALVAANRPPVADAGPDVTVECAAPSGTSVTLDGSESSDPDGDPLSGGWQDGSQAALAGWPQAEVELPVGSHTFTLTVSDGFGGTDSDTVTIVVADTTPPLMTLDLPRKTLWPPNHRLVRTTASVNATDSCAGPLTAVLTSVTSSESDDGTGDGDTAGDIQAAATGTPDTEFLLRAERAGGGPGRVYTATYGAQDPSGHEASAAAEVRVPASQGG